MDFFRRIALGSFRFIVKPGARMAPQASPANLSSPRVLPKPQRAQISPVTFAQKLTAASLQEEIVPAPAVSALVSYAVTVTV